ncbi:Annexin [Corchorus olitorius]|uniref:Annexin n=1 Tax=Corchorus olitorius TaxID=93759 RepID=A0A1R3KAG5_9ROSI|nr:Annexin [Corchorus olitorius]
MVLSLLQQWERNARLIENAIKKGPKHYNVIVGIACSRSSNELFGARKAYHSLLNQSMEEDIAAHFLLALVSDYRYEGTEVNEDVAKSDAAILSKAIKNVDKRKLIDDDEDVIMILATRSKPIFKQSINTTTKLVVARTSLRTLKLHRVLDAGLSVDADEESKSAMTRVILTQKDALKKGYLVPNKIEMVNGFYKDFYAWLDKSIKMM